MTQEGIWQRLDLEGEAATMALHPIESLASVGKSANQAPPMARDGFVSHRAFGGYCGMLVMEGKVLTPVTVRESGEPSFSVDLDHGPVNGWDFFSMSPPGNASRSSERTYALPSKSIKGMVRHVYSIASNSSGSSPDISRLNPVDSLFGWVGDGPNQAIMGRLSFSFGMFQDPNLAWFKIPYPYGEWHYMGGQWKSIPDGFASKVVINDTWRLFPHTPLAPIVEMMDEFLPDSPQTNYVRAVLPDESCRFSIRFWNLDKEELQRLIWCLALEQELAHKIGGNRYLGFGSLGLRVLPDSFLVDWANRYSGGSDENWRLPINMGEWVNPDVIKHYAELRKALNADQL
jgi:hypothetical protein